MFSLIFFYKTPIQLACELENEEIFKLIINDKRVLFGDGVFLNCISLKQIHIPSFITEIGKEAFSGCSSLVQIEIPNSVRKIGDFAFAKCCSLIKITVPSSVIEIGEKVFDGCTSLKEITIPCILKSFDQTGINEKALIKFI